MHFGRTDERVVAEVVDTVRALQPDLIAVSGDLTQRARRSEFAQAREFLDSLPRPQLVVPGNHDVPLHNVFDRFLYPMDGFQQTITSDLMPFHLDEETAVLGINTARSLTIKSGRINIRQIRRVREKFEEVDHRLIRILVTHHPFDLPESYAARELVGRAHLAMESFALCGIDLLLAGHLHVSHTGPTALRYSACGHSSIFVQAGTATSTRGRGESNSFNVIRVSADQIEIEVMSTGTECKFISAAKRKFVRSGTGWA